MRASRRVVYVYLLIIIQQLRVKKPNGFHKEGPDPALSLEANVAHSTLDSTLKKKHQKLFRKF